jgi:hypothetical protein
MYFEQSKLAVTPAGLRYMLGRTMDWRDIQKAAGDRGEI